MLYGIAHSIINYFREPLTPGEEGTEPVSEQREFRLECEFISQPFAFTLSNIVSFTDNNWICFTM